MTNNEKLEKWINEHGSRKIADTDMLHRSTKVPTDEVEKFLSGRFAARYMWMGPSGVLLGSPSPSQKPPDVEWIEGRFLEKVHTDDCVWVKVYSLKEPLRGNDDS